MKTGITPTAGPCLTVAYSKGGIENCIDFTEFKKFRISMGGKRLVMWGCLEITYFE